LEKFFFFSNVVLAQTRMLAEQTVTQISFRFSLGVNLSSKMTFRSQIASYGHKARRVTQSFAAFKSAFCTTHGVAITKFTEG